MEMNRFLRWWMFHSILAVVLLVIMKATGSWGPSSGFGQNALEFGIMVTPLGAGIMWLALRFWWWFFVDFLFGMIRGFLGIDSKPSYPSLGGKKKIAMNDGAFGSQIGGTEFRIDDDGWVYEAGSVGARVGRVDEEGMWRSEQGEIVGRLDSDGVLREHNEGIMSGVFESQEGTGQEMGKVE